MMIVVPSLRPGGMERVASVLSNEFARDDKIEIFLITLSRKDPFYLLDKKVRLFQPPNKFKKIRSLRILFLFFWIRKCFRQLTPKAVLSLGETYNPFVIFSSLGFSHRVLVSNRASPLSSLKGIRGFLNPKLYRLANTVILQTRLAKKILSPKYGGCSFAIIPNPIPQAEEVDLNLKKNIVLNVGSIGGDKNQDLLLQYFHDLPETAHWQLHFVGEGPLRSSVEKLADNLQISQRTVFHGLRKDTENYYRKAKIFAFTSTSEGFPNALAEAMAHGCACISFDCIAGPSDLIDDGVNGFLVPVGDHKQYREKLQLLLSDPELTAQFGENAMMKMKQFSLDKIARRYLDFMIN
ncbi:MAG: glycosyltransferase [Lewinella sp.]|nr:glycosyltransferase [Lewinella sp.]